MRNIVVLSLLALAACGQPGTLSVTTWGEEYIEDKIPAELFEDGWEVRYEKFLVALGEVRVERAGGPLAGERAEARLFDLHKAGPVSVAAFADVADEEYDQFSYAIAPSAALTSANADPADLELFRTNGYSVFVQGVAKKDAVEKRFAWGFQTSTRYFDCEHPDFGAGVTVPSGGEVKAELTIHGDHFFYDDLESADAKVRFQALADADADADGEITFAELGGVDLTSLPLGTYGTGGAANVRNLRDFVGVLVRTVGHFRGEGECTMQVR